MLTIAEWNCRMPDDAIPNKIANYYDQFNSAVVERSNTRIAISSDDGITVWTWSIDFGWRILA